MGSPRISFPHIHFVAAILSQRTFFMTQGEKLFIDGQLEEAYDVLLNEASEGSGRAMYLFGRIRQAWLHRSGGQKAGEALCRGREEGWRSAGGPECGLCQPAGDSYAEEDLPSVHASGGSAGKGLAMCWRCMRWRMYTASDLSGRRMKRSAGHGIKVHESGALAEPHPLGFPPHF